MTRILVTAAVACVLSGLLGYLLLPVLRALKVGQSIREIGPTWHNYKAGTPMMGGLMFIFASLIVLLCNIPFMEDVTVFLVFALSSSFGFVGFLDDYAKLKKKQNEGLTSFQKFMLQLAVSALFLTLRATQADTAIIRTKTKMSMFRPLARMMLFQAFFTIYIMYLH